MPRRIHGAKEQRMSGGGGETAGKQEVGGVIVWGSAVLYQGQKRKERMDERDR